MFQNEEGELQMVYKRVAVVEQFFHIIYRLAKLNIINCHYHFHQQRPRGELGGDATPPGEGRQALRPEEDIQSGECS